MASVYQINKGINKPIEFKGLKAQYIGYLAGGLLGLLLLFAILYIIHVNVFICLVLVGGAGAALFFQVFRISAKYGQYGMMKRTAKRYLPVLLQFNSRKEFLTLNDEE